MFSPIAIIASIIQSLTTLGLMLYLSGNSLQKNSAYNRSVTLIIVSIIIIYFIQAYDDANIHLGALIAFVQYFIIIKLISHAPARNVVTAVFMAYIIQCLTQLPAFFLFICLDSNVNLTAPTLPVLFIMVNSALLTILCIRFLALKTLYKKILNIPGFVLMTIFFVFTIIGIMSYFFNELYAPRNITLICSILFLFFAFVLVVFFAIRSQKKEQAVHYYETYLPILDDMILNIRKTQHNHNNAIQSIASLPQSAPDYDSLASALEQYSSYMAKGTIPTKFLHFENKLLAALLYNKYYLAVEQNILVDIAIHNYFYDSRLTEFQIVDLCGILLDNALEASQENDTIYVEIGTSVNENILHSPVPFAITVKNPGPEATQDFIKKIFSTGYTSKTESSPEHGLGLPYIKSLTQKHHGYIEVSNEMITPDNTEKQCRYFTIHVSV